MQLVHEAWFLTGPTAVGKTAVSLALAKRIGAEIVSMDSMAIYRGMDIGTAKPTPDEQRQVPHHLIDLVEPDEDFSLAQYVDVAQAVAGDIRGRGREVLFAGGTPLYLKGLLRGIFQGPPADWDFRRAIMADAGSNAPDWLHARLRTVDPAAALRLHSNDIRRLVRALEVFHLTGRPISELQQQFDRATPAEACRVFVLERPKSELLARIDRRVDAMFAEGLVDEVRRLLANPQALSKTARQAVGYAETIDYLEGRHDLATATELVKTHSRQLAKRQATWFRSLSECRFVNLEGGLSAEEVAERIIDTAETKPTPSR
jgi:tRNA dimethylallyltransferase